MEGSGNAGSAKQRALRLESGCRQPVPADSQNIKPGYQPVGSGEDTQTPGATPRKDFRITESGAGVNEMVEVKAGEFLNR